MRFGAGESDFYLTKLGEGRVLTSLLGTDSDGSDGWSTTFSTKEFLSFTDNLVIVHIEVLNADGAMLVGDAGIARVQTCADLDASGDVGFADLLILRASWGPCPGCPPDFDDSGDIGFGDLLILLANWGPCPES